MSAVYFALWIKLRNLHLLFGSHLTPQMKQCFPTKWELAPFLWLVPYIRINQRSHVIFNLGVFIKNCTETMKLLIHYHKLKSGLTGSNSHNLLKKKKKKILEVRKFVTSHLLPPWRSVVVAACIKQLPSNGPAMYTDLFTLYENPFIVAQQRDQAKVNGRVVPLL